MTPQICRAEALGDVLQNEFTYDMFACIAHNRTKSRWYVECGIGDKKQLRIELADETKAIKLCTDIQKIATEQYDWVRQNFFPVKINNNNKSQYVCLYLRQCGRLCLRIYGRTDNFPIPSCSHDLPKVVTVTLQRDTLPLGWFAHAANGKTSYYNADTGECTEKKPVIQNVVRTLEFRTRSDATEFFAAATRVWDYYTLREDIARSEAGRGTPDSSEGNPTSMNSSESTQRIPVATPKPEFRTLTKENLENFTNRSVEAYDHRVGMKPSVYNRWGKP